MPRLPTAARASAGRGRQRFGVSGAQDHGLGLAVDHDFGVAGGGTVAHGLNYNTFLVLEEKGRLIDPFRLPRRQAWREPFVCLNVRRLHGGERVGLSHRFRGGFVSLSESLDRLCNRRRWRAGLDKPERRAAVVETRHGLRPAVSQIPLIARLQFDA